MRIFDKCKVRDFEFAILVDDEEKTAFEAVWSEETQDWETDFSYEVLGIDSFDVAAELDFIGVQEQGYRFED